MPNLVGIGLSQVPTNSMLGGMAYQDPDRVKIKKLHVDEISQINSEIDDNATDIFIYDTSKDSDGGAWRKRTSHTSWYNETLGTAYRGTRREFPAVAVIVSTTTEVTIYDGDDPNLPMWMVFDASTSNGINNVPLLQYSGQGSGYPTAALNGVLVLGQRTSGDNWGNPIVNFISEYIVRADPQGGEGGIFNGGVAQRHDNVGFHSPGVLRINNSQIYDVAMTVRQGAPVDPNTGLPTPTIALAHRSGIAVITDLNNNIVRDINTDGTVGPGVDYIDFYNGDSIVCGWDTVGGGTRNTYTYKIPTTDYTASASDIVIGRYVDPSTGGGSLIYYSQDAARVTKVLGLKNNRFILVASSYNPALTLIDENSADSNSPNGMSAFIHTDFNTGWMQGRCKLATLSSTSTTNLTNGQTESDRSPNNLHLTATGTITKTAVATGAELVAYSGFAAGGSGNYFTRAHNGNFDFGTGDFHVIFWVKNIQRYETIYSYGNNSSTSGNLIIQTGGNAAGDNDRVYLNGNNITSTSSGYKNTAWGMKAIVRRSGTLYFYLNGVQYYSSTSGGGSIGNASNTLRIGEAGNASTAQGFGEDALDIGSIALLRAGTSAPSEAQLKKMYHDEKFLFQENAKCALYGNPASNDLVRDLAYDEVQDTYHVATPDGRSDFQGLRRINNTTTAVTTAISAHDGLIVEQ